MMRLVKSFWQWLKLVFLVSNERHVCLQAISYILIIVTVKKLAMSCPPLQFIFPGIGTICIIELIALFLYGIISLPSHT